MGTPETTGRRARANHLTKRVGKYLVGRTIGEGTYAKVKYAQHAETGEAVALKVLDKEHLVRTGMVDQVKREITILKRLHHPHVVDLKEVMSSRDKLFMVMELVTGGDLFDKIAAEGPMKEPAARVIFAQLLSALSYCHAHGVYHRDVKPENVLLSSAGDVKLSDFGLGAIRQEDTASSSGLLNTICGTPNYAAPEVLARQGYSGASADIWSLGVVLYVMLAGCLPFDEDDLVSLFHKISRAEYHTPPWISHEATSVLEWMLQADPNDRASLHAIWEHPWMSSIPRTESSGAVLLPEDAAEAGVSSPAGASDEEGEDAFGPNVGKEWLRVPSNVSKTPGKPPRRLNAFELINDYLDISAIFETRDDVVTRRTRFTTVAEPTRVLGAIEAAVVAVGGRIEKRTDEFVRTYIPNPKGPIRVTARVLELLPGRRMIDVAKVSGNTLEFYKWYGEIANALECCPANPSAPSSNAAGRANSSQVNNDLGGAVAAAGTLEACIAENDTSSLIASPHPEARRRTKQRINAFELIGANLNIAAMFHLDGNDHGDGQKHVQFSTRCPAAEVLKTIVAGTEALGGRVTPATKSSYAKLHVPIGAERELLLTVRMLTLLPGVHVVQIAKDAAGTMMDLMKWYNRLATEYLGEAMMRRRDGEVVHPQASKASSLVSAESVQAADNLAQAAAEAVAAEGDVVVAETTTGIGCSFSVDSSDSDSRGGLDPIEEAEVACRDSLSHGEVVN